ncbi:MAG: hypothetical protein ACKVPX_11110 [Myxococcaceae bacterium]
MRAFFLLSLALALPALTLGCKGPCRQLADKLCECRTNTIDRQQCQQEVALEADRAVITSEDDEVCAALLEGCDCNNVSTAEGKAACGLAR